MDVGSRAFAAAFLFDLCIMDPGSLAGMTGFKEMIPAAKLDRLLDRFHAIESEMASGASGEAFVKLSREHAELAPVIDTARAYRQAQVRIGDANALIDDASTESEIKALAEEERAELK